MMFSSLLLTICAVAFLQESHALCPPSFEPWYDGVCGYVEWNDTSPLYNFTYSHRRCLDHGGNLPSVHSGKENELLFRTALIGPGASWLNNSRSVFWNGLQCKGNYSYSWLDGSPYDYHSFYDDQLGYCNSSGYGYVILDESFNFIWDWFETNRLWNVLTCTTPSAFDSTCDDFDETTTGSPKCMKIFTNAMSWTEAQSTCKSYGANLYSIHSDAENDFIRRTAVANGLSDGIHIGLMNVNPNASNFTWVDGSPFNYTNFVQGFPNPIAGDCTAMQIKIRIGQWMNVECDTKMPFICSRQAPPTQPSGCPAQSTFAPGNEIYSPSYPSSVDVGYCDYMLISSVKTAKVGIRIEAFDVNLCCHGLEVYDGFFGDTLIARLSGHVANGTSYVASGPEMRLVWNVTEAGRVPGWHVTVIQTDTL